ncbi:glycosyltransferase family 9 protein [Melioribacteraceae bacterium 4301-Me]|uniref:glycosyltransferase family 9 protein n=1 Tax=Pyranulibacter aquaticus TaxID=3163344 RepID=UPI0035999BC2
MKNQKRILIVRPDRIGDVVLSTPLPREIKRQFPNAYIAIMLKKYTKDIFYNNPYVNKILLVDDDKSFWEKVREIKKEKFTHALMLLPSKKLNYMLFLSGIPYRVGVGHKLYQFLTFTRFVSRKKYRPLRHEADYCMDLARKIGVIPNSLDTEIFLTKDEMLKVKKIKEQILSAKKYIIGIHTTSGNSSPNWSPLKYKELIEQLTNNPDFHIIITDNQVPHILQNITGVDYPNINKPLRESLVIFAALDYLISSSTGPMHLAAALRVKTISLFCPLTACSPKLWGPIGNPNKIILPSENYCSNFCPGDPKKCNFEGEGGISVENIFQALYAWINQK